MECKGNTFTENKFLNCAFIKVCLNGNAADDSRYQISFLLKEEMEVLVPLIWDKNHTGKMSGCT